MTGITNARVERLRHMAAEVRTAVGSLTYGENRRALTSIADNYELLADHLEQVVARQEERAANGRG